MLFFASRHLADKLHVTMPTYIAIPLKNDSSPLNKAVERHILEHDRYKLHADRGWLIEFEGTTVELSHKLEITGQPKGELSPVGSAILVPVSSYYGRGASEMWEWLKTRLERQE